MIRTICAVGVRRAPACSSAIKNRVVNYPVITTTVLMRRWVTSTSPASQKSSTDIATKAIPGLSSLWLEPILEPFRRYGRYQRKRPYMAQFLSALVVYFVGDMVAQSIGPETVAQDGEEEQRGWVQKWAEDRDWARTMRALAIGGLAAVPGYRWFLWLGNSFNYSSKILSLATKVTVNQLFFTPIFNSYFFGMQSLLSGASIPEILERIKNTVPVSWINSCKIWPAVTAFMFTFIPLEYRNIFGGVIAIGWQTYLSLLNQRAAAKEGLNQHVLGDATSSLMSAREAEQESDTEKCVA